MLKPNELGLCKLVDCDRSRYQDPSNGRIHEYCSRSHAFLAKETGMELGTFPGIFPGTLPLSYSGFFCFVLF